MRLWAVSTAMRTDPWVHVGWNRLMPGRTPRASKSLMSRYALPGDSTCRARVARAGSRHGELHGRLGKCSRVPCDQ